MKSCIIAILELFQTFGRVALETHITSHCKPLDGWDPINIKVKRNLCL